MGKLLAQKVVMNMQFYATDWGVQRSAPTQWLLAAVALAAAAILLYAGALGHEYVWDDLMYLGGVRYYRGSDGALRALTEPFFVTYYRPLAALSFVPFDGSWAQHTINIFLHALNTVLVFQFARELMPAEAAGSRAGLGAAALGAMVFAVHPVGVEAVAWVSGRFDTLMCTFVLGTSLAALGGKLTHKRLALVFVLFACAMGSKESAIGLPVALPLLLLLKWRLADASVNTKEVTGQLARLLVVLALGAALYVAARLAAMHMLFAGDAPVVFHSDRLVDKLNIAALAVAEFVKLIVNPWSHSAPLHPFSYEAGSALSQETMLLLATVLALLLCIKEWSFPLAPLAALAMSWPTLHFIGIPNRENIISDRYALAPLALLLASLAAVAATWLARHLPAMSAGGKRMATYVAVACTLWAGVLAAYTHATIPLWHDDFGFWKFARQQVPNSVQAHKNYVMTLMQQERWKEAETELHLFWDNHPEQFQKMKLEDMSAWMLLRANLGDIDSALEISSMIEEKLGDDEKQKVAPPQTLATFYAARGAIASDTGDWELAGDYFAKAVRVFPADIRHTFRYAQTLFMTGQYEKSEEAFNHALADSTKDLAAWAIEWRQTWQSPSGEKN